MEHEAVRIENWEIVCKPRSGYMAPECRATCLVGNAYGHPLFEEGKAITTSVVVDAVGNKVKTVNRWYVLGKPSKKYAKWCAVHCPGTDLACPFPKKE